jgi:hypothetical protein
MDRICSECRVYKPIVDFPRAKEGKRHYQCKACRRVARRATPAEAKRAWRQAWKAAHPKQRAAQRTVTKAIRAGRLVRPELCESCHAPGRIQAHHDDYAKRLDVRWLCHSCHMDLHVQLRREARDAQAA